MVTGFNSGLGSAFIPVFSLCFVSFVALHTVIVVSKLFVAIDCINHADCDLSFFSFFTTENVLLVMPFLTLDFLDR